MRLKSAYREYCEDQEIPDPPAQSVPVSILDLSDLPRSDPPHESSLMVGAPVSRSGTGMPGSYSGRRQVNLTREEAELAKMLRLTPAEWAKQKMKLAERKRLDPERYNSRE